MLHKTALSATLVCALVAGGTVSTVALTPTTPAQAATLQSPEEMASIIQQILDDTNAARLAENLPPLTLDPQISQIASDWSQAQADAGGISHNPTYSEGYPAGAVSSGENVASGYHPTAVTLGWLNSPGHRANILHPTFTHIGIGIAYDQNNRPYYTQNFAGYPKPSTTNTVLAKVQSVTTDTAVFTITPGAANNATLQKRELILTSGDTVKTYPVNGTTATATNLTPGTTYTWVVKETYTPKSTMFQPHIIQSTTGTIKTVTQVDATLGLIESTNPAITVTSVTHNTAVIKIAPPTIRYGNLKNYTVLVDGINVGIVDSKATTYTVNNLLADAPHDITLVANLQSKDGSKTETRTAKTTATTKEAVITTAPANVAIKPGVTNFDITWAKPTQVSGKLSYILKVTGPNNFNQTYNLQNNVTSYRVAGLTQNTNYTVEVIAKVTNRVGAEAVTATATKVGQTQPDPSNPANKLVIGTPGQVKATVNGHSQITTSWKTPTVVGKLTNYTVKVTGTNYNKTFTTTGTSQVITGLNPSTVYTITVSANGTSTNGVIKRTAHAPAVKATTTASTTLVKVAKPGNYKATTNSGGKVVVAWNKPTTVGKLGDYKLQITGPGYNKTVTVKSNATNATITGLRSNQKYTLTLTSNAVSANGKNKATSVTALAVTTPKTITQGDLDLILKQTNDRRKAHGLKPVALNANMNTVAVNWSKAQATQNKMYHNPKYASQIPKGWSLASENVAYGYALDTVNTAWYNSPGHRANMLNPNVTHMGIGIAYNSKGVAYFTQNFAQYNAPTVKNPTRTASTSTSITIHTGTVSNGTGTNKIVKVYEGTKLIRTTNIGGVGTYKITGLKAGKTYNITLTTTIKSANVYGNVTKTSAKVAMKTLTTAQNKDATGKTLTGVTATPTKNNILVRWGTGKATYGSTSKYTVDIYQGKNRVINWSTTGEKYKSLTITGLKANTSYTVKVTVTYKSPDGKVTKNYTTTTSTKTLR